MATQSDTKKNTILIISQVYPPDPAAVGQYLADAASELVRRGHDVRVLTANRGYDDPSKKYPSRETLDTVQVRRLPLSSWGKRSIPVRLIGALAFLVQCVVRGWFTPRLGGILISTSPPMASIGALAIAAIRRVPITYWVMDVNPDQTVALGYASPEGWPVRIFGWLNRRILHRARAVVTLDRFMADRLNRKLPVQDKLTVIPPWPLEDHLQSVAHESNPFRSKHGLDGKFVVMYSGNMSVASPLTTVLQAALQLQDDPDLLFLFIGSGGGKKEIEQIIAEHKPANIRLLPYQPLAELRYSLSAADVHLVTMGDAIVGICHPCKVYGAVAVARPILLVGPDPCHVSDLMKAHRIGWHIPHGNVEHAVRTLQQIRATPAHELQGMGQEARAVIDHQFSKTKLCGQFCDVVEPSGRIDS